MSDKKRFSHLDRMKDSLKGFVHRSPSQKPTSNLSISNPPTGSTSPNSASMTQAPDVTKTHENPGAMPHLVQSGSDPVPRIVKADFVLIYNGESHADLNDQKIWWMESMDGQYKYFDSEAIRCLRKHSGGIESKQLYRKTGLFRLIRDDSLHEEETDILESEQHWSEKIPLLIVKFCSKNPYVGFHLEIRWDYSDLSIHKVKDEKYAHTIWRAIQDKHQNNWQDEEYIPRKDLDEIFSEGTIKELVNSDESLAKLSQQSPNGDRSFDKNKFIIDVIAVASRLLALCVYSRLPLACLYHLMDNGHKDTDLPLTESECPHGEYKSEFHDLIMTQWRFIAHNFINKEGRPKHEKLRRKIVVPIISAEGIAEGGFGKVFKVHIDPDHHFLCSVSSLGQKEK
jgi:hypothetical protein